MKEHYQVCEGKATYLLEIDHTDKTFAVGSIKGKAKIPGYHQIDASGYKEQIRRIDAKYTATSNNLTPRA